MPRQLRRRCGSCAPQGSGRPPSSSTAASSPAARSAACRWSAAVPGSAAECRYVRGKPVGTPTEPHLVGGPVCGLVVGIREPAAADPSRWDATGPERASQRQPDRRKLTGRRPLSSPPLRSREGAASAGLWQGRGSPERTRVDKRKARRRGQVESLLLGGSLARYLKRASAPAWAAAATRSAPPRRLGNPRRHTPPVTASVRANRWSSRARHPGTPVATPLSVRVTWATFFR